MKYYWLKKLVRDHSVVLMETKGVRVFSRVLDENEFLTHLAEKLKEESAELSAVKTDAEKAEEVADIMEVIESYINAAGLSMDDIRRYQNEKRTRRGGFGQRLYIGYIETPSGSFYDGYCAAVPSKYQVKS